MEYTKAELFARIQALRAQLDLDPEEDFYLEESKETLIEYIQTLEALLIEAANFNNETE